MVRLELPAFQGTVDSLARLAETGDVDIIVVALAEVARQLLAHLGESPDPDDDSLADSLALVARLLYLKSQALLHQPPAEEDEEPAVVATPEDLASRLEEYSKYRQVSDFLRQREEAGIRTFPRLSPSVQPQPEPSLGLDGVTLDDLLRLLRQVLAVRPPEEPTVTIPRDPITLTQKLAQLEALLMERASISFLAVIGDCRSRVEVVVTFLAVLELLKRGQAWAVQAELFADIMLEARPQEPVTT